jgi:phosphatidylserine/phosphatidylglycerophosphate/cardiolipin synthase-like enzyme
MTPMIPHKVHEPFPIAMVNRRPWGAPNHQCVNVPQNEAWLSAIRNAKSTVFIQTPDLNAEPIIPAIKEAVRRGVVVTYYVCLGYVTEIHIYIYMNLWRKLIHLSKSYNDSGELLPFQGGTNEMVANRLYLDLAPEERRRLHVHYYVAKDQTKPIHNKFKQRSCHGKSVSILIIDVNFLTRRSQTHDRRRTPWHTR